MMCFFTLYYPTSGNATKTYTWRGDAWQKTVDWSAGTEFLGGEIEVNNIDDLANCLDTLKDDNAFIVRGGLAYDSRIYNRRKQPNSIADKPSLMEVDRQWVMIDIDNWIVPDRFNLLDPDDHSMIIDAAVEDLLHENFKDVRMFWQFSSSCALRDPTCLKVHLWVWLDKPESNENLRKIFREYMPGIDGAPFSAVQPHYIAAPKLIGRTDPQPARSGWRDGSEDRVTLPVPTQTPAAAIAADNAHGGTGWLENGLANIGDDKAAGQLGFYHPLRGLVWKYAYYVTRGDILRFDKKFIKILQTRILAAPRHTTREISEVKKYAENTSLMRLIEQAIKKHTLNKEISNAKK